MRNTCSGIGLSFVLLNATLALYPVAGRCAGMKDLHPDLQIGWLSHATAINERGQVVGTVWTNDGALAFLWEDGAVKLTDHQNGVGCAEAINNRSQVAGHCGSPDSIFVWYKGILTDLGSFTPGTAPIRSIAPISLNDVGQIAGLYWTADQRPGAFTWEDGAYRTLGDPVSMAIDINEAGQIAGYIRDSSGADRAVMWDRGGERIDLGQGRADGISDRGQIVGRAIISGAEHAVVWDNKGMRKDLTTFGGAFSRAHDINSRGQIIVRSFYSDGTVRSFLWEKGVVTDLGTLGGSSSWAYRINEAGQVIGWSLTASGAEHAFLWEP